MFERLKKTIGSLWAESNVFKSIIIATLFFFMVVGAFFLIVYGHILLGISFSIILIISRLIVGILFHKLGYVKKAKELAPKQYSRVRRVQIIVGGGLFTGFAVLTALRVLYEPLPYPHSLVLFLILIIVGAIMSDILRETIRRY